MSTARSLLVLALATGGEALFKGGVGTPTKSPRSAVTKTSRFASGKVVPTRRVALPEPEPFAEAAQLATDLSITALRVGTFVLMVHHGIDKLEVCVCHAPIAALAHRLPCSFTCDHPTTNMRTQHIDGFTANVVVKFFGFLPGEPSFWTYSAAGASLAAGAGGAASAISV